jgi:hypothetical protein
MTHRNVSFIKSGLRILAFLSLGLGNLIAAALVLILAELLGVIEELV